MKSHFLFQLTIKVFCLLLAFGTLLSLGCQQQQAPTTTTRAPTSADQVADTRSTIAVIDLVRLAEGIGAAQKMREAIVGAERELVNDLLLGNPTLFANASADSLDEFRSLANAKLDQLDSGKAQVLMREAQIAQAQLLQRQAELRQRFCEQVSGVAFETAREQGFDVVLTTAQVFATTADRDITAAVIERINQRNQHATTGSADNQPATAKLPGGGSFPIR